MVDKFTMFVSEFHLAGEETDAFLREDDDAPFYGCDPDFAYEPQPVAGEIEPDHQSNQEVVAPRLSDDSLPLPPPPIGSQRGQGRAILLSILLSLGLHALAFGVLAGIYLRTFSGASWHTEKGHGIPAGDVFSQSTGQFAPEAAHPPVIPSQRNQADSPPALASSVAHESEETLEQIPTDFAAPVTNDETALPIEPVLFGVSAATIESRAPNFKQNRFNRSGSATSASQTAGKSPSPAGFSPHGTSQRSNETTHVWTGPRPAGLGGPGGHGGNADGLDGRGLPRPDYPADSVKNKEEGVVELQVEVLPDGSVGQVSVLRDPGYPRLVAAAIEAARRAHFEPARCDGIAVSTYASLPYEFVIKHNSR